SIVDFDELDDVVAVNDGDAILMAQQLASQLGLAVGISSGANLIGALKVQDQLGPGATVVTMFCDDNKKYLSTDLAREEPVKPGYISPYVDFVGFESLVCPPIDVAIPAAVAV
ncbi:MAG: pyridoxal-phosphate dependent enzyme, partial [Pseudomonadota bacterium]